MQFDIITIFPGFFAGILENGIVTRALSTGAIGVAVHDLRSFTHDRHRTVDDRPFGGGEGMVLKPEPLAEAIESLSIAPKESRDATRETVVLLSAQGKRFTQATAREFANMERIVLICGRYEGVDERVSETLADRELSIGDYVLSGGELGAAVILDATMRLLPGVLGNQASSEFESFGQADGLMPTAEEGAPPRSTHGAGGLARLPPLHPPRRISRPLRAGSLVRRQSRTDSQMAARKGARKNSPQPARPAGAGRPHPRRPQIPGSPPARETRMSHLEAKNSAEGVSFPASDECRTTVNQAGNIRLLTSENRRPSMSPGKGLCDANHLL